MKVVFNLSEESTVVNDTVKITCMITGVIGDSDKKQIDERVRAVTSEMLSDTDWAYSNYTVSNDGFTFRVTAATRIAASANERLNERAEQASNRATTITVTNIDATIPQRQVREEESKLRLRIIDLAAAEANKFDGAVVERVEFFDVSPARQHQFYAATSLMDEGFEGKGLGQSAKISLGATIQIECAD